MKMFLSFFYKLEFPFKNAINAINVEKARPLLIV